MKYQVQLIFGIILILLLSCGGNGNNNKVQDTIDINDTGIVIGEDENETIFYVSSPDQIVEVLNEADLKFKKGLIHDFAKSENYLVQSSQSINLGIYSADLAYCIFYSDMSDVAGLFFSVNELCKKLEVKYLLENVDFMRVKNNMHNPDSVKALSKQYNQLIYDHFNQINKQNILILISMGGFIESMYLALNSIDKLNVNDPIAKVLAEQKYSFEVLRDFAYQNKDKAYVSIIIDDINKLNDIFSSIKPTEKSQTNVEQKDGKLIIGGSNNLIIDEKQFKKLKSTISEIRSRYIKL
jgi:hypothetical protein